MEIPHKGFEGKIEKTDTCWLWRGHINAHGYGRFSGKDLPSVYAHRAVFFWKNGYLPEQPFFVVGHICEVRNCVNPDHLTEQSQSANVRQYSDRITRCPKGHEYDQKNTYIRKDGSRKCRECNRLNEEKKRKRGQ